MKFKEKVKDCFSILFPSTSSEWVVFIIAMVAYGCLSSIIAWNYRIVFDEKVPWDAYFSFDNRAIVMTGGGFERHPLSNYFFDGIRNFALWISGGKMDATFRLCLSLLSTLAISLCLVHIHKYLRKIIELPLWLCYLLVGFFGVFSTNILLSFTPETYTYTLLCLCIFNFYSAKRLKNDEKISATALSLATISIGGLTITNAVKPFFAVMMEKNLFKSFKNILNAFLRSLLATALLLLLFFNRLNWDISKIFTKAGEQYEKFSNPKVTPIWDMIYSWFLGGNVMFSSFFIRDYHNKKGYHYEALFMDTYSTYFPYIIIGLLILFVLWSIIKNIKNPLVIILTASFLVDIIIHCVMKFGLHTAYIYGGHFVFIYPLLLGWLFHSLKDKKTLFTLSLGVFLVIFIGILFNNLYRMTDFFDFINLYYK